MNEYRKSSVEADHLNPSEKVLWEFLSKLVSSFNGLRTEFQFLTLEAHHFLYGEAPKSLWDATLAIAGLLEGLRTKGVWTTKGNELARLSYITGSTIFPNRPEILSFTIDRRVLDLVCSPEPLPGAQR